MIIQLLFATYAGVRLYETYQKRKKIKSEKSHNLDVEEVNSSIIHQDDKNSITKAQNGKTPELQDDDSGENRLQKFKKYTNVSIASGGLLLLGNVFPVFTTLGLISYVYGAIPYMKDVEKSIVKDKKVNVDVLFFTADVLTLGIGQYFTAAVGLYLMNSSKVSSEKAKNNSKKIISDVFQQLPQKVWIVVDGVEIEHSINDIKKDYILIVRSGDVIPADGIITKGVCSIDQQALTGEAQPVEKDIGDKVYANTVVISGIIQFKVEKSGEETTAAKIGEILLHSIDTKSNVQLKGEEWADKATLPMMIAAALTLPVFGPVSTVVLINSHMGNRIRLLAPLGTLTHISAAAKTGILVKDGRALEGLIGVDTILFDKTGTLTTGEPEVLQIIPTDQFNEAEILRFAATAEGKLMHPIAKAIQKKAKEKELILENIDDSNFQMGYGISVNIGDKKIRVGSCRYIKSEGIEISEEMENLIEDSQQKGNTMVFVAIDNQLGGSIELQSTVRPEAKEIINDLRQFGIKHIGIVSGDHEQPTQKLSQELGIDEYYYDILPENKASIVEQLQNEKRTVCFIGDGINDALAMKKADYSISLSGATTIATDVAEFILIDGSLTNLCDLFTTSQNLNKTLNNSLKLTIAPGILNLGGAFLLHYSILTSMVVSTSLSGIAMVNVLKSPGNKAKKELGLKKVM